MSISNLPGPRGNFLLGHAREVQADMLGFITKTAQDYPDIFRFRAGPVTMIAVLHPDYIRQMLVTQADKFYKSELSKSTVTKYLGDDALVILDGDDHQQQRRLVQPAFHAQRIAGYADVMVDYTHDLLDRWQPDSTQSVDEAMSQLAMEIVAKTLFDAEVRDQADSAGKAMGTFARLMQESTFGGGLPIPDWVPTKKNRETKRMLNEVNGLVSDVIDKRRENPEDIGDLLSMLLRSQDEAGNQLSDQQLLDQVKSLFFAGHETTAKTLTWTFYLLSQHPEIEAKLHAEVDAVLGQRRATYADYNDLTYTQKIVKESMRLYPPAWILDREPQVEVAFGDYTLPAGSRLFFSPFVVQRDPRWWADPLTFDPERFTPEREKDRARSYTYIPFGGGPRVCIGNMFAMMEAVLIIATVAQHVRLELAPDQQVEPAASSTLYPKYGMRMIVRPRGDR